MGVSKHDEVLVTRTVDHEARAIVLHVRSRRRQQVPFREVRFSGVVACRLNVDPEWGYIDFDVREVAPEKIIAPLFRYPDMMDFYPIDFWTGSQEELLAHVRQHPVRAFRLMGSTAELSSDGDVLAECVNFA